MLFEQVQTLAIYLFWTLMIHTVDLLDDIEPDRAVKTAGREREDETSEKKRFKGQWLAILVVVGNQKNINKSEWEKHILMIVLM